MKSSTAQDQLSQALKQEAIREGFNPVGIARVPGSERLKLRTSALERWLKAENQADMTWMEAPRRKDVRKLLTGVKSLLAVGLNYYVDTQTSEDCALIARYGWGRDYHRVVKKRLRKLGRWLEKHRPNCDWKVCVDSSPLLDKAWAEEAGLGWIGKNSNLINKKTGSWMVLGHLLCTEPLTPDNPSQSLCGQCQLCLDACPTKAITEPFVVDARLCIAYHTIENRNPSLPKEIGESLNGWIAGCDICQEICPWNKQPLPSSQDPDMQPKEWILKSKPKDLMSWSDQEWENKLKGSALKRIKPWMWRRNAKTININKHS